MTGNSLIAKIASHIQMGYLGYFTDWWKGGHPHPLSYILKLVLSLYLAHSLQLTSKLKMACELVGCVLLLLSVIDVQGEHAHSKRALPINQECDSQNESCRKGDWIASSIADCRYTGFLTCDAQNDVLLSWTVDVDKDDNCQPDTSNVEFTCGEAGTDTRCVCSDHKVWLNKCKCQYWPDEDPGVTLQAPCTGHYAGGNSTVHHWACCNNCNDTNTSCDGVTWQGGTSTSYCDPCGESTGGGTVKYYFNCGSCSQQEECRKHCDGPIQSRSGLCWKWLDCFKGCCLAHAQQPSRRKRDIVAFCGDGVCNIGESPTTCPVDCCYQANSECATDSSGGCVLPCCGDPSCCME